MSKYRHSDAGKGGKKRPSQVSPEELEANENRWRGIRYTELQGRVKIIKERKYTCKVIKVYFNNKTIGKPFTAKKEDLSLTHGVNKI